MPLVLDNAPHALLYNSANGAVKIIHLLGTQGWAKVWASTWTTGWTALAPFDRGSQQRLVAYKAASGQMKALRVFTEGSGAAIMTVGNWSSGYSSVVPVRLVGTWYDIAYDKDTGDARIVQITQ
jgi:hypothetical protein